jgi:DNA-binding winged helix-turn-helix (wHTH) protein/tetratricopeptide (TPR) repeat protein
MWQFSPFRLDIANQSLHRGEVRIPLMPKPFAVLQYLVERSGRLVSQEELMTALWPDTYVQPEVLRRYILEVRRALGDHAETPSFIETFPKRGYQFIAPVTRNGLTAAADESCRERRPVLVGRDAALAQLDGYFRHALEGQRQLAFVSGECGIGKTSLLEAFQGSLKGVADVHVVHGQCVEGFAGKEPYYPILEAVGQLIRGPAGALTLTTLADAAPTWMMQFPALIRGERRADLQRQTIGATPERMVRELSEALEIITAKIVLVLMIEDLHWADRSTLDVLSMLARRRYPARLLLLATFRPVELILSGSPLKTLKQDLLARRLCHELPLAGLGQTDVADYLTSEFPGSDRDGELALLIHRHSDGNPLFMAAILEHLAQAGVLVGAAGNWSVAAPLDQLDVRLPETLRQMLDVQLGHLRAEELNLLKCASVSGPTFTVATLAAMLERDPLQIERECAALSEHHHFLRSCGACELPDGTLTTEYEFRHALYRDALYLDLAITQRLSLHRVLAEALERVDSPSAPALAPRIAAHYEEAREYEPAVRHLIVTARNAALRYSHRESVAVLEHAWKLLPRVSPGQRDALELQILEHSGDAQYALGDMAESAAAYQEMAARAGRSNNHAAQARTLMRWSDPISFLDPDRAITACEEAARIASAHQNRGLETEAELMAACWSLLINGWRRDDVEKCSAAAAELDQLGVEPSTFTTMLYSRVLFYQSDYAKCCELADRALTDLSSANAWWAIPAALHTKAGALAYMGRFGEGYRILTEGIEAARKNNNTAWFCILSGTLFWLRWQLYDTEGIQEISRSVSERAAPQKSARTRVQATLIEGFVALTSGELQLALEKFEEMRDLPPSRKSVLEWRFHLYDLLGWGEVSLALRDLASADTATTALLEAVAKCEDAFLIALSMELGARVALARRDGDRAESLIERGLETMARVEIPLAAWRLHARAWETYRHAQPKKAARHREKARELIRQVADSLEGIENLRTSFLAAMPVRRVLEASEPRP